MDHAAARRHMVDSQILPNRVTDERIIDIMSTLPRETFVPDTRKSIAYVDEALDIGNGRFLMEPMVTARLLQTASPKADDVALVIGCSSGYTAACLARIVSAVVAIEGDKQMALKANEALAELEIDNVAIMDGDLASGYPGQAPYDLIVFDGAVPNIPDTIKNQLAEGGRLIAIIGGQSEAVPGSAVLITRFHDSFSQRNIFELGTPMLPGFEQNSGFQF
ncbi:MAG: protein-L-isoaspartate O-methyltransferase [Rhodospirillales bacterium]|nr:protein-L-isoaspartate O-methyltransferase [Rhodospirillales bacterium]